MKKIDFTGERLMPKKEVLSFGDLEHLSRYAFVDAFCENKNVLDIACGEGYGSMLLSKKSKSVVGVDISKEIIENAKFKYKNDNLFFTVGSTDSIPLNDNCIDLAVSFETIEHHDKHDLMINELKRVLNDNGVLVISTPIKSNYLKRDPENEYHIKELEFEEFERFLNKYFSNVKMFKQKIVMGGIISPLENNNLSYFEKEGSFEKINDNLKDKKNYNTPYFTIAVCSDVNIENFNSICFFDGSDFVLENLKKVNDIKNSIEYRIVKKIFNFFK